MFKGKGYRDNGVLEFKVRGVLGIKEIFKSLYLYKV